MALEDANKKIRQALNSLELFAGYYASSDEYQKHKQHVAGILRATGSNGNQSHRNLLIAVADAIEKHA